MVRIVLSVGVVVGVWVASPVAQSYVPHRVFDTVTAQFTDFEVMLADLVKADVVFVGEQHGDRNSHRLEHALLEGLAARRDAVVLSLEMFERDAQVPLDQFRLGHLSEAEFLRVSRPWPRYATDYKPLVDLAIDRKWQVLAANVPRPIASEVARTGVASLGGKTDEERAWFAAERFCPTDDEYYGRFKEAMGSHPSMDELARYYDAQCLKDETMAESIARTWRAAAADGTPPLVVHYNGAFHSDFGLGTASRTQRRLPDRRMVVVTLLPVASLDELAPGGDDLKRARYLVYTRK